MEVGGDEEEEEEEGKEAEETKEEEVGDMEWEEVVKSGGSVSFIDPNMEDSAGWLSPPGHSFQVRGPQYLTTKVKIAGSEPLFKPLAFDWLKSGSRIDSILEHPNSRVRSALDRATATEEAAGVSKKKKPFVWAFHLQVPSKEHFSAIAYFVTYTDFTEDSLCGRFLKGDDAYRNTRLKLIANIVEGPWIVKTAVGEHAICILGRSLTCRYLQGANFLEVDVDIGSSMVASAIVHLAIGYITTITVDLAFLIEAQTEEELPEKLLGTIRLKKLDLTAAVPIELLSTDGVVTAAGGSFPARLWKSIGQGFSTFLQSGNQNQYDSDDEAY
jgi:hypothetical protein